MFQLASGFSEEKAKELHAVQNWKQIIAKDVVCVEIYSVFCKWINNGKNGWPSQIIMVLCSRGTAGCGMNKLGVHLNQPSPVGKTNCSKCLKDWQMLTLAGSLGKMKPWWRQICSALSTLPKPSVTLLWDTAMRLPSRSAESKHRQDNIQTLARQYPSIGKASETASKTSSSTVSLQYFS